MSDIYKPPESDLTTDEMRRELPNIFWRVFFWINIVLFPLVLLIIFTVPDISVLDSVDVVFFIVSVFGLYLFAYAKELKSKKFWKLFCILYLVWYILYEYIGPLLTEMSHYGEPAVIDGYNFISLALAMPTAYALYRLGFKAKD